MIQHASRGPNSTKLAIEVPLKVNQFSTFPNGGAARAARRVHEGLCDVGVDSRFYYWKDNDHQLDSSYAPLAFEPETENGWSAPFTRRRRKKIRRRIIQRYERHVRSRPEHWEVFSGARLLNPTRVDWGQLRGDIAHLHWMAFFIDYPSFFASIPDHVPIVWTLHDMNPLTGGCHYSSDCHRFGIGCGQCPQLMQARPRDESFESFRVKKRALRDKNLTLVAPSQWMLDLALESAVLPENARTELIQYGFDLGLWQPVKQHVARRQLGLTIAPDTTLIGFGAEDINHRRKGMDLLIDALRNLDPSTNVECLVFGSGQLPDDPDLPPMHSVGFVDTPQRQTLVYSAMDFFVLPSREDNSPQTGLEAMACGTPVVGFHAGGVPEYILPRQTGLLCSTGNTGELADSISWLANHRAAIDSMSVQARQMMERQFGIAEQSRKYIELYCDLLGVESSRHVAPLQQTVRRGESQRAA